MDQKKRDYGVIIIAFISLALIVFLSINNFSLSKDPIDKFLKGERTFSETVEELVNKYSSDKLKYKYDFVNYCGLFLRLSGRRAFNEATLLNNGMLTWGAGTFQRDIRNQKRNADAIFSFSNWLREHDIPYTFVMLPDKMDMNGTLLPVGLKNTLNEEANQFVNYLYEKDVQCLDLRPIMTETAAQVSDYFYRTDHHWNIKGAFKAYQIIMRYLKEKDIITDTTNIDESLWDIHEKEDWFLGSRGKRVGTLFAGTDSLMWYTPKFTTNQSCIIPNKRQIFKGDFATSNIREKYITTRDLFTLNPFCVYIGGDYPLVRHINPSAGNKKRILILKNSYVLPLQAFLSTSFEVVDVIDPRHYSSSSIAEYCDWYKPDYVFTIIYPNSLDDKCYFSMGENKVADHNNEWEIILDAYDLKMKDNQKDYHYAKIPVKLEAGNEYMFSFASIDRIKGESDGVSVVLYNFTTKKVIFENLFDVDCSENPENNKWFIKMPEKISNGDDYRLLVYDGIRGKTKGTSINIEDIQVLQR